VGKNRGSVKPMFASQGHRPETQCTMTRTGERERNGSNDHNSTSLIIRKKRNITRDIELVEYDAMSLGNQFPNFLENKFT